MEGGKSLKISKSKLEGAYEVAFEGDIDLNTVDVVEAALEPIFKEKVYRIIVDLSRTRYISSAGIGYFLSSIDRALKNKGNILFVRAAPKILEIFEILGLPETFKFFRSREEALKAF